jgi:hypothetical protein
MKPLLFLAAAAAGSVEFEIGFDQYAGENPFGC